ncbi:hypothetical protein CC80DRAFT_546459 [Byssothecium circinans]|uniref:Uncharacterized protein n=1 Tax=Byssothecium circinans TaxID=147558 RepID=A0A6A5U312_9PLEO|nr:hypothetical protein CC80DRAFT_546459 [Byssothecium circinans]
MSTANPSETTIPNPRSRAIQVYAPMYLHLQEHEIFQSQYPITINGLTIWSSTPIHILPKPEMTVSISTAQPLGPQFARGWNSLPDELKVRVFDFCVVDSYVKGAVHDFDKDHDNDDDESYQTLRHILRSTPEMASLACEAYYQKNVFALDPIRYWSATTHRYFFGMYYPNPSVGQLIRRIKYSMGDLHPDHIPLLNRLASGAYGLPNVKHMLLGVAAPSYLNLSAFERTSSGRTIKFPWDGDVEAPFDRSGEVKRIVEGWVSFTKPDSKS